MLPGGSQRIREAEGLSLGFGTLSACRCLPFRAPSPRFQPLAAYNQAGTGDNGDSDGFVPSWGAVTKWLESTGA